MSSSKTVLDEALRLPPSDRAAIARELIASLDAPADSDVEEAWLVEVERREQEVSAGTAKLEEWSVVRERIAARLRSIRP